MEDQPTDSPECISGHLKFFSFRGHLRPPEPLPPKKKERKQKFSLQNWQWNQLATKWQSYLRIAQNAYQTIWNSLASGGCLRPPDLFRFPPPPQPNKMWKTDKFPMQNSWCYELEIRWKGKIYRQLRMHLWLTKIWWLLGTFSGLQTPSYSPPQKKKKTNAEFPVQNCQWNELETRWKNYLQIAQNASEESKNIR